MNTTDILQLIKTVTETGYQHIDVTHEGSRIVLSNSEYAGMGASVQSTPAQSVQVQPIVTQQATVPVATSNATQAVEAVTNASDDVATVSHEKNENTSPKDLGGHIVESPIVGTFYEASGPDADAFVKVGDKVSKGDVLCIIEAMKLMNEIEADADGEIAEVLVENEAGVEFGQPLFRIV